MDEVMKLHQDEGIFHLMHGLPTQRKRTQRVFYNAAPKQGINNASSASAVAAGSVNNILAGVRVRRNSTNSSSTSSGTGNSVFGSSLLAASSLVDGKRASTPDPANEKSKKKAGRKPNSEAETSGGDAKTQHQKTKKSKEEETEVEAKASTALFYGTTNTVGSTSESFFFHHVFPSGFADSWVFSSLRLWQHQALGSPRLRHH